MNEIDAGRKTALKEANLENSVTRLEAVLEFENARNGKAVRIAEVAAEVAKRYRLFRKAS